MAFPTGARLMLQTAQARGVEICFANPGTTEMPFVEALDAVPGIRAVLGLFEGVCTGAADGYGRMLARPALTLSHLGPGFANGIANLHNARRARTPIVNVIGDHASWHLDCDAPLTSDIAGLAGPVSGWQRRIAGVDAVGCDTHAAIDAATSGAGQVASLIFPVDFQRTEIAEAGGAPARIAPALLHPAAVPGARIDDMARRLRLRVPTILLLGKNALCARGQIAAARLAAGLGVKVYGETFPARAERGGGLPDIGRLPYFPEPAMASLAGAKQILLVGALKPVSYFGYEGIPSRLAPEGSLVTLAAPHEDGAAALEELADALGLTREVAIGPAHRAPVEEGRLSPNSIAAVIAGILPEHAIVSVEGGTCGYPFAAATAAARRCTLLTNTGGAIGQGLPVAIGAALACPGRKVIALQSDGSAQYTIQSLWTMAREHLPIIVTIVSNRRYGILQTELSRAGITEMGPQARQLTRLDDPPFDWPAIAKGYGVSATRALDTAELRAALSSALASGGPHLIEMVLR